MRVTSVDVSVMNIGGADVLADLKNVKCVSSVDLSDGTTIGQFGQSPTPMLHRVTLETELLSTTGVPPVRVTGLNITQAKIGGTEYLGNVVSGLFRSSMTMKDGA